MRSSTLSVVALGGLVSAQYDVDPNDVNNAVANISSCQSITCNMPFDTICTKNSEPGTASTVGIVADAITVSPSEASIANLSFTLVTGMSDPGYKSLASDQYEFADAQLFVGLSRSLKTDYYPTGCALMLQYQGQTFPLEQYPGNVTRTSEAQNTTSCEGILHPRCQAALAEMILRFQPTSSPDPDSSHEASSNCTQLTTYLNTQLTNSRGTCGQGFGTWLASSIKVSGGSLPSPVSLDDALSNSLGGDGCYPVLPEDYRLFKVAETRHVYYTDPPTADAAFYSKTDAFYSKTDAGLSGWTPVITLWNDEGGDWNVREATIQFTCLSTLKTNGEKPESPYEHSSDSGASSIWRRSASYVFASWLVGFWLVKMIMSGGY